MRSHKLVKSIYNKKIKKTKIKIYCSNKIGKHNIIRKLKKLKVCILIKYEIW